MQAVKKISRLRPCVTLVACALGGCGGDCFDFCPPIPTAIDIHDNKVFVPSVRAGWSITDATGAPSQPQSGQAIEAGALTASGSNSQSIDAGDGPVVIGGKSLAPPDTLRNDFRFFYYDVQWRWRRFFGHSPVGLEATAGAAFSRLDVKVSSPSQQASERLSGGGPTAGVGMVWRMRPGTSLQVRTSYFAASDIGAVRAEGYLVQALGRNAALRAGYSWWDVEVDRGDSKSKIDATFSGPSLGFELQF